MRVRDSTILSTAAGVYIGTLVIANVTAGKLFSFAGVAVSAGAFAYLLCLATSDVIVEVYGPKTGYKFVRLATIMNILALLFGQLAVHLPISSAQQSFQEPFAAVFDASAAVILASIIGFPITDTVETFLWHRVKRMTAGNHLWLRVVIVKIPGQLLDATIFFSLAFYVLPQLLYGAPLADRSAWLSVMIGAWLYGLWKGCVGTIAYPLLRAVIPWIRNHRVADISDLDERVREEAVTGRW